MLNSVEFISVKSIDSNIVLKSVKEDTCNCNK